MKMTLTLEFESSSEHLMVSQALASLFPGLAPTLAIRTNGNVGPGTSQPSAKLDVLPATSEAVREYPPGADALDKTFIDMGAPMTPGVPVEPRQLVDDKPRRTRRTKAEMEAARQAEEASGQVPRVTAVEALGQPATPAARVVTIEELRAAGNKYVAKVGAPKFMELLRSCGDSIKNYGDIPADKWPALIAKFEAELAA